MGNKEDGLVGSHFLSTLEVETETTKCADVSTSKTVLHGFGHARTAQGYRAAACWMKRGGDAWSVVDELLVCL